MTTTALSSKPTPILVGVKTRTIAVAATVVVAVALPQLVHAFGAASGVGPSLGATLLPMHLPVLLLGLVAGPVAGGVAGALAPLAAFALSGMPVAPVLPFMIVELTVYGAVAGMMCHTRVAPLWSLLVAQVAGRLAWFAALAFAVFVLGNQTLALGSVWGSVAIGLPGLALQWITIPFVVAWLARRSNDKR